MSPCALCRFESCSPQHNNKFYLVLPRWAIIIRFSIIIDTNKIHYVKVNYKNNPGDVGGRGAADPRLK